MANKKTMRARKNGFCSQHDENRGGNKIFKGQKCDTRWDNPNSKKRSRKVYKKQS